MWRNEADQSQRCGSTGCLISMRVCVRNLSKTCFYKLLANKPCLSFAGLRISGISQHVLPVIFSRQPFRRTCLQTHAYFDFVPHWQTVPRDAMPDRNVQLLDKHFTRDVTSISAFFLLHVFCSCSIGASVFLPNSNAMAGICNPIFPMSSLGVNRFF